MNRIGCGVLAALLVLGPMGSPAVAAAANESGPAATSGSGDSWAGLLRRLGLARGPERDAINAEILRFEVRAAREYTARQRLLPAGGGGNLSSYGGGR